MDGTHAIERSADVTGHVLQAVFEELYVQHVGLEDLLLKTNMVLSGYDCPDQATPDETACWTIRCLGRHVPVAVPGVVFLSGGQSEEAATVTSMPSTAMASSPGKLSFSSAGALQASARSAPGRITRNDSATAQGEYQRRAAETAAARTGTYGRSTKNATVAAHA